MSAKIKTPYTGTAAELDEELQNFKCLQTEKKTDLSRHIAEQKLLQEQEKQLQSQLNDCDRKLQQLMFQRQQEQDLNDEHRKLVVDLRKQLNLKVCELDDEPSQAASTAEIEAQLNRADKMLDEMRTKQERINREKQENIDRIRESRSAIDSEVSGKQRQLAELEAEHKQSKQKIDSIENSAKALATVTQQLNETTRQYEEFTANSKMERKKEVLDTEIGQERELQTKVSAIDKDIAFLSSIAKVTAEIGIKDGQLRDRTEEQRKVRNKHAENLSCLINGRAIEQDYQRNVQTAVQNLQREIGDLNRRHQSNQQSITRLQMQRTTMKDELAKAERELTDGEEKLFKHCAAGEFADVLQRVKMQVDKLQLDVGALKASDKLYKKWVAIFSFLLSNFL